MREMYLEGPDGRTLTLQSRDLFQPLAQNEGQERTKYVTTDCGALLMILKSDEFCSAFLRCFGGGECRQSIAR
jgi:ssDNA-binding Zn-finger/Zn-ribbon topoisomerase 1